MLRRHLISTVGIFDRTPFMRPIMPDIAVRFVRHLLTITCSAANYVKMFFTTHVQVFPQIQPVTSVIGHVTEIILTGSPEAVEGIKSPVGGGELFSKETQLPLHG